nr:interstitial collagenase-like [Lytechinus pictus]
MMNTPRCGLSDVDPDNPDNDPNTGSVESLAARRRKRYVLTGNKWEKNELKWHLNDGTNDLGRNYVTNIMNNALQFWEDASALDITEGTGSDAEIQVSFEEGAHGDNGPFDGPGGTLAHAFYPTSPPISIAGDAHFDDGETFTDGQSTGTNLLQVATHEFGHSLGLDHSDVRGAVMFPFYLGYNATFALDRDDIAGIQAIYGVNANDPEQPDGSGANCFPVTITWATSTQDGKHYLCNATYCYRMSSNIIDAGYPKRIQEDFPGLPDGPDASFYYPATGKTYVFKGSEVWRMSNQSIDSGYPTSIEYEFPGIPSDLSAAFIWHANNKIYFVKGQMSYKKTSTRTTASNAQHAPVRQYEERPKLSPTRHRPRLPQPSWLPKENEPMTVSSRTFYPKNGAQAPNGNKSPFSSLSGQENFPPCPEYSDVHQETTQSQTVHPDIWSLNEFPSLKANKDPAVKQGVADQSAKDTPLHLAQIQQQQQMNAVPPTSIH